MATRRVRSYATAYSFGTDGSAALAGNPIASHRRMVTMTPQERHRGVNMPRWAMLLLVALLAVLLIAIWSNVQADIAFLDGELARQRTTISAAMASIEQVEGKLATAQDEAWIRSIAMNRLGMHVPTDEQIYTIPTPQVNQPKDSGIPSTDRIGVLDLFKGTTGY